MWECKDNRPTARFRLRSIPAAATIVHVESCDLRYVHCAGQSELLMLLQLPHTNCKSAGAGELNGAKTNVRPISGLDEFNHKSHREIPGHEEPEEFSISALLLVPCPFPPDPKHGAPDEQEDDFVDLRRVARDA